MKREKSSRYSNREFFLAFFVYPAIRQAILFLYNTVGAEFRKALREARNVAREIRVKAWTTCFQVIVVRDRDPGN